MKTVNLIAIALLLTCGSGCAPTSHVVLGNTRPAITSSQVRIYISPPAHYEEIALLDTTSMFSFATTDQQKTDKVIERLKEDAAKLGANGILLGGIDARQVATVTNVYGSATAQGNQVHGSAFGVSAGAWAKNGKGLAIYVDDGSSDTSPAAAAHTESATPASVEQEKVHPAPSISSAIAARPSAVSLFLISKTVTPCSSSANDDCVSANVNWDLSRAGPYLTSIEGDIVLTTKEGGGAAPVVIEWPLSDPTHLQARYSETVGIPLRKLGPDAQWLRYVPVSAISANYRVRTLHRGSP